MSSRVSIGTLEGYATREVVFDETTTLSVYALLDGAAATVSTATAIMASGSTTVSLTPTIASNKVSVSVTTANLSSIGVDTWGQFKLSWKLTIDDSGTPLYKRATEIVFVAEQEICPSIMVSDITNYYAELALPNSLPTGKSNWWWMAQIAWREIRDWIETQTTDRRIWKVENSQSLRRLHLEWTLWKIAIFQDSIINGNIWAKRAESHAKRIESLKATTLAYVSEGTIDTWGESAGSDVKTLQSPKFWTGRSSARDWGKR